MKTDICIAMTNKTLSLQVVPAPVSVQSGAEIEGVRFDYAFDRLYKIVVDEYMYEEDFDLVLSLFNEVFTDGDGSYFVDLSCKNIKEGVALMRMAIGDSYCLDELFESEMGLVNVYIEGNRYLPDIRPCRDFVPGFDFCVGLNVYIHSGIVFYTDGNVRMSLYDPADSFMCGYVFANKKKFDGDADRFLRYVEDGLMHVNDYLCGNVYDIMTNDGIFVATNTYVEREMNHYMILRYE